MQDVSSRILDFSRMFQNVLNLEVSRYSGWLPEVGFTRSKPFFLVTTLSNEHFLSCCSANAYSYVVPGLLNIFWENLKHGVEWAQIRHSWLLYRHIQILAELNNEIQKNAVVTLIMIFSIILHALSLTSLVHILKRPSQNKNWAPPYLFAVIAWDTFLVVIVTFGAMSAVYHKSKEILQKCRWEVVIHESKNSKVEISRLNK